ncbi:hypothetical protein EX895_000200 [Sporisorium graminicola]|uniref:AB hydrolase-1 domain-containing protein n=1 Tax=Sporisorium graminicola TaxID=280036 RepID=A0A4U7L455_9BASI|nr:hypothetical protein EX895_000200 [Sporisorium graminicola]TKY90202.1 hypothetical protein EX895_000200 [Sporisorium graminicola]
MSGPSTQFYTLPDNSGCRMAYRVLTPTSSEARARTPLFLINGLSAVMVDWTPLFEALGATRTVVISDHRGIGESVTGDDWDQELSLESMGLDVIHLAHHLGYTTVDLLGFSMGGHITQALLSSPELAKVDVKDGSVVVDAKVKVRKAVLTATMVKLPRGEVDMNALNEKAESIADKKERNDYITQEMMQLQYHPAALGPSGPLQRQFEHRLQVARTTKRPAYIIGLQFLAIQSTDLRKQLHRIPATLPVMVIHGRRDQMVLYSESERILNGIKHAKRLQDTPSTEFGHFWYDYFELDYWIRSISNFLDHGKVGGQSSESKL